MKAPNFYSGSGLDRAGLRRKDAAWLAERLAHASCRFVPVWRGQNLVLTAEGAEPVAALLHRAEIAGDLASPTLLGMHGEATYFAVNLSMHEEPLALLSTTLPASFTDLRRIGPLLPRLEGTLLAYARGLAYWHERHAFCGACGSATEAIDAGHVRRCANPACGLTHFPRTDPAVIMLVHDGDRCLLGRKPGWPAGMNSTLAGFVEPGESLEEAVAREVMEETGVAVDGIEYHSSQPWPFPASLMLGYHARARSTAIEVDPHELEDARWYERRWLLSHQDGDDFRLPRRDSIARRLIEDWLRR